MIRGLLFGFLWPVYVLSFMIIPNGRKRTLFEIWRFYFFFFPPILWLLISWLQKLTHLPLCVRLEQLSFTCTNCRPMREKKTKNTLCICPPIKHYGGRLQWKKNSHSGLRQGNNLMYSKLVLSMCTINVFFVLLQLV